jgi:hypothetical protein
MSNDKTTGHTEHDFGFINPVLLKNYEALAGKIWNAVVEFGNSSSAEEIARGELEAVVGWEALTEHVQDDFKGFLVNTNMMDALIDTLDSLQEHDKEVRQGEKVRLN